LGWSFFPTVLYLHRVYAHRVDEFKKTTYKKVYPVIITEKFLTEWSLRNNFDELIMTEWLWRKSRQILTEWFWRILRQVFRRKSHSFRSENFFTTVFSLFHNLEKPTWFGWKKIFFYRVGFFHFLGILPKNGFLGFFSA
jgi:hypothetical protein